MTPRAKLITTLVLVLFLAGLGVADYYISSTPYTADLTTETAIQSSSSVPTQSQSSASPMTTIGVQKQNGPEVKTAIEAQGFTTETAQDLSFLAQIAGSGADVHSLAILKNGDRAGSVTWMESATVKNRFIALKEALLTAFSQKVRDLRDETVQTPNGPVRNELTFFDPTLSTERLFFVRVRERLYEFHISQGKEELMNTLIDALTTK